MTAYIDEAQVEIVTVDYFRELGYEYIHGPVIAPDGSDRLAGLRDTLLPKLLSGEIELPEAEAIAQEVV
jgi:hypothetical protein